MTASYDVSQGYDFLVVDYVGEAAIGLQGNLPNPSGVTLLIVNSYCWLVTPATLAATLNVGIAATGVDNTGLHGALPLNGGALTAWMGYHPAVTQDAALTAPVPWLSTLFLTFTTAAQSALPCVARFYIKYIRV